ncbi:S-layer homology domain-containing protein [Paenibacillus periandrae]|uniref:S-layer homology domain-containing protein n=1 Tax=Paenibacillus periandrae TaxID=1761741 RepID=UPI001F09BCD7|nr:S-layer homology domain-containing protein [Paenibacillus periandrae]
MNKIKLKSLIIASALVLLNSGISYGASEKNEIKFMDMKDHWANVPVKDGVAKGYVDGYEDGTFKPDKEVTRAEFIKLVSAALGQKVDPEQGSLWYLAYVRAMKEEGILSQHFYEDDMGYPMIRAEMAMVASKAVDKESDGTLEFAVKTGLLNGVGGGELDEMGVTTRAQAITVIERILAKRAGKALVADEASLDMLDIKSIGTNIERHWNIKPIALPVTGKWGNGVAIKLNKVVYLDYAKGYDQPYGYLFDGYYKNPRVDLSNYDVIALEIEMSVDGTDSGVYDYRDFVKPDTIVAHGDVNFNDSINPTGKVAGVDTGKKSNYTGWVGYSVKKEIKQAQFDYYGKSAPLQMRLGNDIVVIAK